MTIDETTNGHQSRIDAIVSGGSDMPAYSTIAAATIDRKNTLTPHERSTPDIHWGIHGHARMEARCDAAVITQHHIPLRVNIV